MSNKVSILSTAPLDQQLVEQAAIGGIELDAMSFIKVEPAIDKELEEEITELCGLPATVVFTSANAVRAISDIVKTNKPDWDVYCVGAATKNALFEYSDTEVILGVANSAEELAEQIIEDSVSEVVFFCGDKRMDTLPDLLRGQDITVYELVVYTTAETPQVAASSYDGIMFYSPSGVRSFFSVNTIGAKTVLFAIGNTTAEAIKEHTDNRIVVSETPSREELVNSVIQFFYKQPAQ